MAYLFHMERSYFSHLCGKYYKAAIKRCRLIFEQKIFYYPHRGAQGPVLTNRKGDSWGRDGEFWICRNKMYLIPLHPSLSRILMIPPPPPPFIGSQYPRVPPSDPENNVIAPPPLSFNPSSSGDE